MKAWLILAILSYLSYAISTSIDKYMMDHKYRVIRTDTLKMFFNGLMLLIIGLLFFDLNFTSNLIFWSLLLGFLYAASGIIYYVALKLEDAGTVVPSFQSLEILLVFVGSVIIFNELVNNFNFIGVVLILGGVYSILSTDGLEFPRLNKAFFMILFIVILNVIYSLLVKKSVSNIEPINLAIMMYFSATVILLAYQLLFKKESFYSITHFTPRIFKIIIASFFGAMGTFLLYSALSLGNASKVYPMAGLQSVFIFIIASIFLKEKFYWHRLLGTIAVFSGIFLVSV